MGSGVCAGGWNAQAVVCHRYLSVVRYRLRQHNVYGSTVWAVLHRVVQQIGRHLLQPQWVNLRRERRWRLQANLARAHGASARHGLLAQPDELGWLTLERELASL